MRLLNNELRSRAAAFARDWAKAHYEKGETQSFWNDFFQIFGIDRKRVATYEHSVDKLRGGKGFIDLFYPGTLIIEQKSLGRDLLGARLQAMDYTHGLKDAELPRFVLAPSPSRPGLTAAAAPRSKSSNPSPRPFLALAPLIPGRRWPRFTTLT